ncbi:MAG: PD-(D/E)XK nuclease family protein [Clostridia bacterium]|nr:PD-(D/E)XK nuclease family protein [Clostridia bacterium]
MLHLILGEVGSGKTRLLDERIADAVKRKSDRLDGILAGTAASEPRDFLIVPEQSTVAAERRMAESDAMPPSAPLFFEATNFTRLADTFFRSEGGLALRYADRTARTLAMWLALRKLTPPPGTGEDTGKGYLSEVPSLDPPSLDRYLSVVRELSAGRVGVDELSEAEAQLSTGNAPSDARLVKRVRDVSLVLSKYREILSSRYADSENILGSLAERMKRSKFFCGSNFYFDSFTGFTEQQYAVIEALLKTSEITVTLPLPDHPEAALCYREPVKTRERLIRMAEAADVKWDETKLGGNRRTDSRAIKHLTAHLFDVDYEPYAAKEITDDGSVRIVEAEDPYVASRFVAADILQKTRKTKEKQEEEKGEKEEEEREKEEKAQAHYRDLAILSGDPELYRGVLDVDLDRNGIPYFFSRRVDLSVLEPLKLVASAYRVVTGNYRPNDVISVVKCGFSGLSDSEADELDLYSEIWKLSGDDFRKSDPWTKNPDGFEEKDRRTAADGVKRYSAAWLEDVNRAKEKVLVPLRELEAASKTQSVSKHREAISAYLNELNVPEQLIERAELAREDGDAERADLYERFWEVASDALDTLDAVLGDEIVTAEEFSTLFDLVCRTSDVGRIPSSSDEVLIGSADLLRAGGVKHVYLFGANEGEFPGAVRGSGYFSESDVERLSALGVKIGSSREIRASRELFGFLRAVSAPSVSVTIVTNGLGVDLTAQRTPSTVLGRIRTLLPNGVKSILTSDLSPLFYLRTREEALFSIGRLSGDPIYPALARELSRDEKGRKLVEAAKRPIPNSDLSVPISVASELFPNGMTLSHSRLEKIRKCPLSDFCSSVLKLNEIERAEFGANDIGSYVHAILEEFFRKNAAAPNAPGPKEIEAFVKEYSEKYLDKVGQGVEKTARMEHLFGKLRKSSEILIQHLQDEIEEGNFVPRFFELDLKAGKDIGDSPSAFRVKTDDGGEIFINGKIDRVDTAKIGDGLYLRVVDYKTGSDTSSDNKLNLAGVDKGESPQLLLYLFALLNNENPAFRDRLGVASMKEVHPAAVRYLHAATEKVKLDAPASPDEVKEKYEKIITRSGCALNDDAVLDALDRSADHRFTPERKTGSKQLLTDADFAELQNKIENNLRADVGKMRNGSLRATPGKGCEYCKMAPICRRDNGKLPETQSDV